MPVLLSPPVTACRTGPAPLGKPAEPFRGRTGTDRAIRHRSQDRRPLSGYFPKPDGFSRHQKPIARSSESPRTGSELRIHLNKPPTPWPRAPVSATLQGVTLDDWVAKLVAAARSGDWLDLADGEDDDPADADQWPDDRRVPADAIRAALLTPDLTPDPRGLRLHGADITGLLDLEYATVPCRLRLTNCRFSRPIHMEGATVDALVLRECHIQSLDLDGAQISGSVFLQEITATGGVRTLGSHIGGHLVLRDTTITNPGGIALYLDNARVDNSVQINGGFTGEVRALGATVGGSVVMSDATITNPGDDALSLHNARITEDVVLSQGFTVIGRVRAIGAHIGGQLTMTGATLANPGGDALCLDSAQVAGDVFLKGINASGEVRALGARIGGQLNLRNATLTNPDGDALSLHHADITGNALLDEGFSTTGAIRAPGAHIGGQLLMRGAVLTNPGGVALDLENADIARGALLNRGFTAQGRVLAVGTQIGGQLSLRGARVEELVLTHASVRLLAVDPKPTGKLSAMGWKLGEVEGALNQPRGAIAWLDASSSHEFAVQPWHELAAVYDRHGRPADAKRLRFEAARRVTRHAPWWSKPVRWLYGAFAGYGYYPLLAAFWLVLAAVISGTATYLYGPVQAGFNPWLYGAAVVIPPAAAITPSTWTVTDPLWLAWVNIALKAFGWLQTGILLAGLTGLLKKS